MSSECDHFRKTGDGNQTKFGCVSWLFGSKRWFIGKGQSALESHICAGDVRSVHAPKPHRPSVLNFICVKIPSAPEAYEPRTPSQNTVPKYVQSHTKVTSCP